MKKTQRKLQAGALLQFTFDELPNTLNGMVSGKLVPAQLVASLPKNYCTEKDFPILVYLGGGNGGTPTEESIRYPRKLTSDLDFISVRLPLFKKEVDLLEVHEGKMIQAYDDYPLIAKCYKKMFKALFSAIPNIDHSRNVIGGMSNGAHTTALLLSALDPFILKHFSGFYLLDGGWNITSLHKPAIQNKRIIKFLGGRRRRKWRRSMLDWQDALAKRFNLPNYSIVKMPGVEHAFPDAYIPQLQTWCSHGDSGKQKI